MLIQADNLSLNLYVPREWKKLSLAIWQQKLINMSSNLKRSCQFTHENYWSLFIFFVYLSQQSNITVMKVTKRLVQRHFVFFYFSTVFLVNPSDSVCVSHNSRENLVLKKGEKSYVHRLRLYMYIHTHTKTQVGNMKWNLTSPRN